MKEIWKDIKGYEGFYRVSNMGRVETLERIITRTNGRKLPIHGKILTPIMNLDYEHVILADMSKKIKNKQLKVHRLVAQAFIPNPENKPQINHKNFIRNDNRVENLEWVTVLENSQHAMKYKRDQIGRKGILNGRAKLTEEDVLYIRENKHLKVITLIEMFNVGKTAICDIRAGRSWKHL